MNGLDGVPMIRSGDHHRINIFALQNIPVITIRNSAGSTDTGILDRGFQPVIVRIANGSHAHLSLFLEAQHIGQVRHAHAADANVGDHEPVVRARLRVPAQNSSRRQIERARNQHAALEECPASDPMGVAHHEIESSFTAGLYCLPLATISRRSLLPMTFAVFCSAWSFRFQRTSPGNPQMISFPCVISIFLSPMFLSNIPVFISINPPSRSPAFTAFYADKS